MPLRRHDSYGRPLPRLADASREEPAASEKNLDQRERILQRLRATMEEHYPYLLRRNVTADVSITFKVVRGMIQDDIYVGIVRQYRGEEE